MDEDAPQTESAVGPEPAETEPDEAATTAEPTTEPATEPTVGHRDFSEWQGRELVDRDGHRIGKLDDVYFDVETDLAQFATVKEGGLFAKRRLAFVPLSGVTIGPDNLQVSVSKAQIKDAPKLALEGDALSQAEESALYHHYELNYTPSATPSGRRLARR
jgi:sporulation protein YlmC with PRC-barrel domain